MSTTGAGPGTLPVMVDGSKNPQSIPDALAYSHFFTAIAAHPSPTPQEQGRQNAQLALLQLADADSAALTGLLAKFRVQLDQIESNFAAGTGPSSLASLQTQKSASVATIRASLQQALTPAGLNRIDQYVQTRVKTHIVIYGGKM
ncbi:MAG TPA: hypothetical protein VHY84_25295 [Bryobacteraceae bacterium]|nr:hypothetical protein [Bryobacteraceae bacterium]